MSAGSVRAVLGLALLRCMRSPVPVPYPTEGGNPAPPSGTTQEDCVEMVYKHWEDKKEKDDEVKRKKKVAKAKAKTKAKAKAAKKAKVQKKKDKVSKGKGKGKDKSKAAAEEDQEKEEEEKEEEEEENEVVISDEESDSDEDDDESVKGGPDVSIRTFLPVGWLFFAICGPSATSPSMLLTTSEVSTYH